MYEKAKKQEWCEKTGNPPIRVRWSEIRKRDETYEEYRRRLVAQELKRDNREDLFVATTPMEAKKLLFNLAGMEGMGYAEGE